MFRLRRGAVAGRSMPLDFFGRGCVGVRALFHTHSLAPTMSQMTDHAAFSIEALYRAYAANMG